MSARDSTSRSMENAPIRPDCPGEAGWLPASQTTATLEHASPHDDAACLVTMVAARQVIGRAALGAACWGARLGRRDGPIGSRDVELARSGRRHGTWAAPTEKPTEVAPFALAGFRPPTPTPSRPLAPCAANPFGPGAARHLRAAVTTAALPNRWSNASPPGRGAITRADGYWTTAPATIYFASHCA